MGRSFVAWLSRASAKASCLVFAVLVIACCAAAAAYADPTSAEQRTTEELESVRSEPLLLRDFLLRMPKGADLHTHLDGRGLRRVRISRPPPRTVSASIRIAKSFTKSQPVMAGAEWQPVCEQGDVPAATVHANQPLYSALIDSFSMRGFVPSEGVTGHDHFFESFTKFGGTDPRHLGEWLDEIAARAARQNVQYLEVMATPTWNCLNDITKGIAWREDLASLREELLAKGLAQDIPAGKQFWDAMETTRQAREQCGTDSGTPACKVEVRYIYQVFRNAPKELVFAAALFGFELASADPRVVGINLVGQEDAHGSMTDYAEHMRMISFLRELYPHVHVSLHAGELTEGLVPPEGLCCHIRMAVEQAKADRIGHGTDIMYEDDPAALMKKMADKGILARNRPHQQRRRFGHKGQEPSLPALPQIRCAGGACDRRRGDRAHRPHQRICESSQGLRPHLLPISSRSSATASNMTSCPVQACGTEPPSSASLPIATATP